MLEHSTPVSPAGPHVKRLDDQAKEFLDGDPSGREVRTLEFGTPEHGSGLEVEVWEGEGRAAPRMPVVPEDLAIVSVLEGVHVSNGLHFEWPAVAFRMDYAVLLRDADGNVRSLGDAREANWLPGVDGQRIDHPEVVPSLAVDHRRGDAGERALERPDEILDCLLWGGPSQGDWARGLPREREEHRDSHDLRPVGPAAQLTPPPESNELGARHAQFGMCASVE